VQVPAGIPFQSGRNGNGVKVSIEELVDELSLTRKCRICRSATSTAGMRTVVVTWFGGGVAAHYGYPACDCTGSTDDDGKRGICPPMSELEPLVRLDEQRRSVLRKLWVRCQSMVGPDALSVADVGLTRQPGRLKIPHPGVSSRARRVEMKGTSSNKVHSVRRWQELTDRAVEA
jgi:hypothetical protein